jgi:hypothetical protein
MERKYIRAAKKASEAEKMDMSAFARTRFPSIYTTGDYSNVALVCVFMFFNNLLMISSLRSGY